MAAIDESTGIPRGYAVIRKSRSPDYGRLTLFQVRVIYIKIDQYRYYWY